MAWLAVRHPPFGLTTASREATWRENMMVALLGAWTVGGLYLDGWAHVNLGELETVLTPWHGVLYSGLLASLLCNGWMVARRRLGGLGGREAVPPGYSLGLVGLGLFCAGGVADLLWHAAFGIEVGIDALLSPPHLVMFCGALLALTSPLRAAWISPDDRLVKPSSLCLLPSVVSIALATSVIAFFFMYLSVFTNSEVSGSRLGAGIFGPSRTSSQQVGIASILITNAILFGPLLFAMRRWPLPAGAIIIVVGTTVVLLGAVRQFAQGHAVVAALGGAVLLEALRAALRPTASREMAFRLFAAAGPLALWSLYFTASFVARGFTWSPEGVSGVVIWTGLSGVALSLLVLPPPMPRGGQSA